MELIGLIRVGGRLGGGVVLLTLAGYGLSLVQPIIALIVCSVFTSSCTGIFQGGWKYRLECTSVETKEQPTVVLRSNKGLPRRVATLVAGSNEGRGRL